MEEKEVWLHEVLGNYLKDSTNCDVPVENLKSKFLGVCFGGICAAGSNQIVPLLSSIYVNLKTIHQEFECIFIGIDEIELNFDKMISKVTFLHMPFYPIQQRVTATKFFNLQRIPSIILVKGGHILEHDILPFLLQDPKGDLFPWKNLPWDELWNFQFTNSKGIKKEHKEIKKIPIIGFLFGASWCPSCKELITKLIPFYNSLKEKRTDFEIVYVSKDDTIEQFDDYVAVMPWLAIPFEKVSVRLQLERMFNVDGIPYLSLVHLKDSNADSLAFICPNAINAFEKDPDGLYFPWFSSVLRSLDDSLLLSDLLKFPSLIIISNNPETRATAEIVAEKSQAHNLLVCFGSEIMALAAFVRQYDSHQLFMIDIENHKKYVPENQEQSNENLTQIIAGFCSNSINFVSL